MADFAAVLRKTIGNLGQNTPEMREKVYEKARSTIAAKLAAIDPPPPQAVADRQLQALEDAIAQLRGEYDAPAPEEDNLEDVFSSLIGEEPGEEAAAPVPPPPLPQEAADMQGPPARDPAPSGDGPPPDPVLAGDPRPADPVTHPEAASGPPARRRRSRGRAGLIAALLVLLVLGGTAYAVWLNRADFAALFGGTPVAAVEEPGIVAGEDEDLAEAEPAPETETAAEPAPEAATPEQKFTQRLLPDGTEVDVGPAEGATQIGEGSSVAPSAAPEDSAAVQTPPPAGEGEAAVPEGAIPVGQRAIFYEERTSTAQGSAETGTIVWSLVRESPGGDASPEPAIRAEMEIPANDLQLRMTIRRNADDTLPASHIIEMIFLTPENFGGGGIGAVTRVAFKETEQAPGNPLLGIPARIADGFFLVALSDTPAETEANLALMRRQSWIDIPLVYQSGRRALISLEKGVPGDRVFDEALRAWAEATAAGDG